MKKKLAISWLCFLSLLPSPILHFLFVWIIQGGDGFQENQTFYRGRHSPVLWGRISQSESLDLLRGLYCSRWNVRSWGRRGLAPVIRNCRTTVKEARKRQGRTGGSGRHGAVPQRLLQDRQCGCHQSSLQQRGWGQSAMRRCEWGGHCGARPGSSNGLTSSCLAIVGCPRLAEERDSVRGCPPGLCFWFLDFCLCCGRRWAKAEDYYRKKQVIWLCFTEGTQDLSSRGGSRSAAGSSSWGQAAYDPRNWHCIFYYEYQWKGKAAFYTYVSCLAFQCCSLLAVREHSRVC